MSKPAIDYGQAFAAYQGKINGLQEEIAGLENSVKAVTDQIKAKKKELNKLTSTLKMVAPEMFPAKGKKGATETAPAGAEGDEATGE